MGTLNDTKLGSPPPPYKLDLFTFLTTNLKADHIFSLCTRLERQIHVDTIIDPSLTFAVISSFVHRLSRDSWSRGSLKSSSLPLANRQNTKRDQERSGEAKAKISSRSSNASAGLFAN